MEIRILSLKGEEFNLDKCTYMDIDDQGKTLDEND